MSGEDEPAGDGPDVFQDWLGPDMGFCTDDAGLGFALETTEEDKLNLGGTCSLREPTALEIGGTGGSSFT